VPDVMALFLALALVSFGAAVAGDVGLIRFAIKRPDQRWQTLPFIVIATAAVVATGYVLAIVLAFAQCAAQSGGCFT
jgi:hypothetical protein